MLFGFRALEKREGRCLIKRVQVKQKKKKKKVQTGKQNAATIISSVFFHFLFSLLSLTLPPSVCVYVLLLGILEPVDTDYSGAGPRGPG